MTPLEWLGIAFIAEISAGAIAAVLVRAHHERRRQGRLSRRDYYP